jgi:hypothetical protein
VRFLKKMTRDRTVFLAMMRDALESIREPRLFETERGYQGELLAVLRTSLPQAEFPGDPIIEQEYQKRLPEHGITIRPDLIIHVPFERDATVRRRDGNFVAIEIKRKSVDVEQAFESLRKIREALNYALTIFINIGSQDTHADLCPASIATQTVCFAVLLKDGAPVVKMERAALFNP